MVAQSVTVDKLDHPIVNIDSFNDLECFMHNHYALHHPLFIYLKECAKNGFTSLQYQIYRDNYFYRTFYTIPSVAYLAASAAINFDIPTLTTVGKNLYEETGCGQSSKAHSYLLDYSHNIHGNKIFNIKAKALNEVGQSQYLLPETLKFVEDERRLYQNQDYHVVLGAAYAHETAANPMLENFYESFFLPYKEYYEEDEFKEVVEYYSAHLNGVEEEHAYHARHAALRAYQCKNTLLNLAKGASGFLSSQATLWDGLHRELQNAEHTGNKVPLR